LGLLGFLRDALRLPRPSTPISSETLLQY